MKKIDDLKTNAAVNAYVAAQSKLQKASSEFGKAYKSLRAELVDENGDQIKDEKFVFQVGAMHYLVEVDDLGFLEVEVIEIV